LHLGLTYNYYCLRIINKVIRPKSRSDFLISNFILRKKCMELDFKQLGVAIRAIAEEKNLSEETVSDAVEQALAAAYRRDYGDREQEIKVKMNLNTGEVTAFITKEIVQKVENSGYEISLADAQVMKKNAAIGETIEVQQKVESFGRVAAQTAKHKRAVGCAP